MALRLDHLSEAETSRVLSYVQEVKDLTELRDSRVYLMVEPADVWEDEDDVHASTRWPEGHNICHLRLGRCWERLDTESKRNAIVHELLHFHHRKWTDLWEDLLKSPLHFTERERRHIDNWHKAEMELLVSTLTLVVERLIPAFPGSGVKPTQVSISKDPDTKGDTP